LISVREDVKKGLESVKLKNFTVRKRLPKTQQAGKDLASAVVVCEFWRLAVAL
jgi:hypothetical protein